MKGTSLTQHLTTQERRKLSVMLNVGKSMRYLVSKPKSVCKFGGAISHNLPVGFQAESYLKYKGLEPWFPTWGTRPTGGQFDY
jgi:hypothetical protein